MRMPITHLIFVISFTPKNIFATCGRQCSHIFLLLFIQVWLMFPSLRGAGSWMSLQVENLTWPFCAIAKLRWSYLSAWMLVRQGAGAKDNLAWILPFQNFQMNLAKSDHFFYWFCHFKKVDGFRSRLKGKINWDGWTHQSGFTNMML